MSVISKFEQKLIDAGFSDQVEYGADRFGPAEFRSYFEFLLDRLLAGEEQLELKPEKLWTAMKRQNNYLEQTLAKAAEDYTKLENKMRQKEAMISDLLKEISNKH